VIGVSPLAVTAKVPALFSAKEVEVPEVKTGPPAVTVRVKDWVVVLELLLGLDLELVKKWGLVKVWEWVLVKGLNWALKLELA